MKKIEIPLQEYELLKKKAALFNDKAFLKKLDLLVELLYQEKKNWYMGDDVSDLEAYSINKNFEEKSKWDEL